MFDPTKPVRTQDGRAVRILATDLMNPTYPIAAAVLDSDGRERVETFTKEGNFFDDDTDGRDLVNVPSATYRTYRFENAQLKLGGIIAKSFAEANALMITSNWDGVVKVTETAGRLVKIKVVTGD